MKNLIYLSIFLILILTTSCSILNKDKSNNIVSPFLDGETNQSIDFFQTEWQLIRVGAIKPKLTATDNNVSILFSKDNSHFAGFSGCNRYFGKFEVKKEDLRLMDIGSTKMACPDNDMSFENNYLNNLNKVTNYSINEDTLFLKNKDRVVLVFIAR